MILLLIAYIIFKRYYSFKEYYVINIKSSKSLKEYKTILDKYNANIKNKDTTITVE